MKNIIWLVSYPKSGNTWMRVFLTNYLRETDTPATINDLITEGIASSRALFDRYSPVESSNLTYDEIDLQRPKLYRFLAQDKAPPCFIKVHDAYTYLPNGEPIFPQDITQGAIYIMRNPLDIAVSGMDHYKVTATIDAVQGMADPAIALGDMKDTLRSQFRQKLGSWSSHIQSWLDDSGNIRVHPVRYEDMLSDPSKIFKDVVSFCGLPVDINRLEKAIQFSDFNILKTQEDQSGFRERSSHQGSFFRRGQAGSWRDSLRQDHAEVIVANHAEMMRRFGYLSPTGEIYY